jgi:hypothetical protein
MSRKRFEDPIPVRLSAQAKASLERDAATQRVLVADLIRERLDLAQMVADSIAALRQDIAFRLGQDDGHRRPAAGPALNDAMLLEMLLLLRTIAGPQKQTMVGGELALHGHTPWQPKESV